MENVNNLIIALSLGQKLENDELSKQAIIELAKIFGIKVEVINTTELDRELEQLIENGKRVDAIKLYRVSNPGLGLKEAKDEIDRRFPRPNVW